MRRDSCVETGVLHSTYDTSCAGADYSTNLGILDLSKEFSPENFGFLRRGNLSLRDSAHRLLWSFSYVSNKEGRRRIQELESERAAGLQIVITPQALRPTLSTSTSIYAQPVSGASRYIPLCTH